ncbi:alpha/beta hydrolase [Sphaerisporangium dianthi]|uniref:Alpha/beta hydrolase n=1 Tax=Sphaerisporangium dianthi TaxID=1436120 RepID=A0ABV9CBQ4_9ACTN
MSDEPEQTTGMLTGTAVHVAETVIDTAKEAADAVIVTAVAAGTVAEDGARIAGEVAEQVARGAEAAAEATESAAGNLARSADRVAEDAADAARDAAAATARLAEDTARITAAAAGILASGADTTARLVHEAGRAVAGAATATAEAATTAKDAVAEATNRAVDGVTPADPPAQGPVADLGAMEARLAGAEVAVAAEAGAEAVNGAARLVVEGVREVSEAAGGVARGVAEESARAAAEADALLRAAGDAAAGAAETFAAAAHDAADTAASVASIGAGAAALLRAAGTDAGAMAAGVEAAGRAVADTVREQGRAVAGEIEDAGAAMADDLILASLPDHGTTSSHHAISCTPGDLSDIEALDAANRRALADVFDRDVARANAARFEYEQVVERAAAGLEPTPEDEKAALRLVTAERTREIVASVRDAVGRPMVVEGGGVSQELPVRIVEMNLRDNRIAVVIGDPRTADRIVARVQGMNKSIMDTAEELERTRLELNAIADADPGRTTAAVYWLYGPPNGLIAANSTQIAKAAAPELTEFVAKLRAQNTNPGLEVILESHSYGTVLAGDALAHDGLSSLVDRAIFLGSPGLGVDSPEALHMPAEDMWAGTIQGDFIVHSGTLKQIDHGLNGGIPPGVHELAHGVDPTEFLQRLPADEHTAHGMVDRHGDYWIPGSTTLQNRANVIVGHPERVVPARVVDDPDPETPRPSSTGGTHHPLTTIRMRKSR